MRPRLEASKVAEFIALSSPINEESSKDKKKFIDTLIARFPNVVAFGHTKSSSEDFIAENSDMDEADPALKLP
jgi:hypothetical protein